MKNPTYATFIQQIDTFISNRSLDELKKIILGIADKQNIESRNNFLLYMKESLKTTIKSQNEEPDQKNEAKNLIQNIQLYKKRMLAGEFFDEDEHYSAMEREDHYYWNRNDYYDDEDEIDYSKKDYVLEAIALLDKTKQLFRHGDIKTSLTAYDILFDIFDNADYYDGEEYFVYGFSYKQVIDKEALKEHEAIYLRCKYLASEKNNNYQEIYHELSTNKDLLLTDLIESDRKPLPDLENFTNGFIQYLSKDVRNDCHLIDALFVHGGIDEIKDFAYSNGEKHPPVFLYYYQYAKENEFSQSDRLKLIQDGINIIPEKYKNRSNLGLDLVEIAKKTNDKGNLLIGYSTAFYSHPCLSNLAFFTQFILSENLTEEINKLKAYSSEQKIKSDESSYFNFFDSIQQRNIYSLETAMIDMNTLLMCRFILGGIEPLLHMIDPKQYLGFKDTRKNVAIVSALALKTVAQDSDVMIVNRLIDFYCLDCDSEEYRILKKMISDRSKEFPLTQNLGKTILKKIESLAINRVSHILGNKLRGGYESACLLLVACAEVKQIVTNDGNDLIKKIDTEFKRFSAFRRPLKDLTDASSHLVAV